MPTIRDVAAAAGVSRMTVSNVLNGRREKVSADTAARVEEVIRQIGYVPDGSARTLSSRTSRIIALVINHVPDSEVHLGNPHDAIFVGATERAVTAAGYTFMMASSHDVLGMARTLGGWRIAGLVVLGSVADEVNELVSAADRPVVFVDNYSQDPRVLTVGIDDELGGRLAAEHLLSHGHREIAFAGPLRGGVGVGVIERRLRGLRAAVEAAGITPPVRSVVDAGHGAEEARAAAAALLGAAHRPTAVLAASDVLAIGIMGGLRDLGTRVPDDMSVIGFDDSPVSALIRPALTTVHQDTAAKGQAAVRAVLRRLDGGDPHPLPRETPRLVVRQSVGAPPDPAR